MGARRNRYNGKAALVLAGGGLTGAVYEIGALRAINALLVDRTVNDFDIYIGTSAGAFVSSLLANGLSPEEMMQTIDGSHPELQPVRKGDLLSLNRHNLLRWGTRLPGTMLNALWHYMRHLDDMSLFDVVFSLSEALPSGFYDPLSLERYVREVLTAPGNSNRFRDLGPDLFIIATNLDTGERAVFGRGYQSQTPISLAVSASAALPLIYTPVRIGQNEYVDGGLRGNASIDLAIEHGAKLVVCINPMVPYDNSDRTSIPFLGPDGGHLSDKGIEAIASQILRILLHSGLHYHIKQVRRANSDVDIILIEPRPDDYQMFFYNIMRYSARLIVARHGFETVTLNLAENYERYAKILARHDIEISQQLVREELAEIQRAGYDPAVIRRILEVPPPHQAAPPTTNPVRRLNQTLAELERALETLTMHAA